MTRRVFAFSLLAISCAATSAYAMQSLDDKELSETSGQALFNLAYTAPTGSGTGASNLDYGYYKLGLEAKIELNANIRNLQLGCGGANGPGACDLDMQNVALSGLPDSYLSDGTPVWNNGRASSSAVMTNPFIEFAIKNPNSASTREIVGFRTSAESISGFLTAGTDNIANPTDGIKTFSGYLQVAQTPVTAKTDPSAKFGLTRDQMIYAQVVTDLGSRSVYSNVNGMQTNSPPSGSQWGINVAQQTVNFNFPQTTVTGNRMSQLNLVVNNVPIPTIAIGANDGALQVKMNEDLLWVTNSTFYMGTKGVNCAGTTSSPDCSYIKNLKTNVTVKENFNLIHNLPLTGTGGYLSLQKQAMRWPGSNVDDIAQPGWWMSFAQPLDFGALNPTQTINMDDFLPQIATFITNYLSTHPINLSFGEALSAAFGLPLYKSIGDIDVSGTPAVMTLQNLTMDNHQKVVSNCFGTLKFC